jgi:hypothetical protein
MRGMGYGVWGESVCISQAEFKRSSWVISCLASASIPTVISAQSTLQEAFHQVADPH